MRRIATALCAAGAALAVLAPGTASAAFGPAGSFGGPGSGDGQLNHPQGAAASASALYIADTGNNRVGIYDLAGTFQGYLGLPPASPSDVAVSGSTVAAVGGGQVAQWLLGVPLVPFSVPATSYGIAIDGSGTYYVSDTAGGVINKYNGLGQSQGTIGQGQLSQPRGLTIDGSGSIYVADTGNSRIVKLNPSSGAIQASWSMPSYTIVANGTTTTGTVQPHDVAVGASGKVFAPDASNNLFAIMNVDGSLNRLVGAPASDPSNPCRVVTPWGAATNGSKLYVVSTGENMIRTFDDNAPTGCPAVNFGSGGGVTPPGGGGGGGSGGTAGAVSDQARPRVSFVGFPRKGRCARKNFTFTIHAEDDTRVAKIILFVNRRRTDTQEVNQQFWNVRVRIPVRKVRAELPPGASVRVLIGAKAVDASGKSTKIQRAFRICG